MRRVVAGRSCGPVDGTSEGNDVIPAAVDTNLLVVAELGEDPMIVRERDDGVYDLPRVRSSLVGRQLLLKNSGV